MTLRDHLTPRQRQAHELLDLVRAGVNISQIRIRWALIVLGDGTV
jgi:hypothetical protein